VFPYQIRKAIGEGELWCRPSQRDEFHHEIGDYPMPITQFVSNPPLHEPVDIPAEGFPIGEEMLRKWFEDKHGREATELEIGTIMAAMSARESKYAPRPEDLWGWRVEPAAWRADD
jgi:hypothetical protein